MKVLSLVLKLLITLVFIVVIAAVALPFIIDPNDYKPEIVAQVKDHTGRDLDIGGDIDLSVFPWIGVKIGEVSLSNAAGFSDRPFARIGRLDVKVKFLPLLRQAVEVDKVRLHGLFASLEVDAQGNSNWQDLAQPPAESAAPATDTTTPTEPDAQGPALAALAINGIEIIDAEVRWNDAAAGTESSLSKLNLTTSAVRFNAPISVSFSTRLTHNQPVVDSNLKLDAQVTINETLDRILVGGLSLDLDAEAPDVMPQRLRLELSAEVDANLADQIVVLDSLKLATGGLVMHADLEVTGLDSGPRVTGAWHMDPFNARKVAGQFGVELPPTARVDAMQKVALASRLALDTAPSMQVKLDGLDITLDDTMLTGFLHVLDTTRPELRYQLHMTAIDADAYLPPPADEAPAQGGTPPPATTQAPEIVLPLEPLRSLDLDGELRIDRLTITAIPVTDILVQTRAVDGVINVKPVSLKLLQGRASGGAVIDATGSQPAYALQLQARELNAGPVANPLIAELKGDDGITLDGRLRLAVDVKTNGTLLSALKRNATGRVTFDMDKTTLAGVDLEYFTRNVVADYLVSKSIDVPDDWRGTYVPERKTAFDLVHATANIRDGRVTNPDMRLQGRRLVMTGKGEFDIMQETMDYNAIIDVNPERRQTTAEKLLDQPLGVSISGPFAQPNVSVDKDVLKQALGDLAKAEAKARLEEEKARLKEKARAKEEELRRKAEQKKQEEKQKLEDKLKNKLKDLF